jgi:hypothetical protein
MPVPLPRGILDCNIDISRPPEHRVQPVKLLVEWLPLIFRNPRLEEKNRSAKPREFDPHRVNGASGSPATACW